MRILGLDIGGANLKAAHSDGTAKTVPFELWKAPDKLHRELKKLAKGFPKYDRVGITMTGESCDCYLTKREGVNAILDEVLKVFPDEKIRVWLIDEGFHNMARAREMYLRTASSNWHVLASYCGTLHPKGVALMIDIGSTTTDIIPIVNGKPASVGKTDAERLLNGELIYIGVGRTPTAMVSAFEDCREVFATVLDCHILLGQTPEDPGSTFTADGRPATREFSRNRLARMLGGDKDSIEPDTVFRYAEIIHLIQMEKIQLGIEMVAKRYRKIKLGIYVCGSGEFLFEELGKKSFNKLRISKKSVSSLNEMLGQARSSAACAWALTQMMESEPDK